MRKAKLMIGQIDGGEPWHSIAAVEVIKEHLKREEFGSALSVLSELKSEYWLGGGGHEGGCGSPQEIQRAEGHVREVRGYRTWNVLGDGGVDVLRSLLIGLGNQGELDFVMEILERVHPPDERLPVLEGIVKTSIDKEDVLSALLGYLKGEEFERVAGLVMDQLLSTAPPPPQVSAPR